MIELALTFWETASVLEGRLESARKRFDVSVGTFHSRPTATQLVELIATANEMIDAEANRGAHAGSARTVPLQAKPASGGAGAQ